MSKKLLSEAQVRRFQALATIKPLSEMNYNEESENEALYNEESEDMAPEAAETDFDAEQADEPDMDDTDVEIDEDLVEKFMDAVQVIQQVSDALGGASEMGMEMEDEAPEMELDAEMEDEAPEMEDEAPEMELDADKEDEETDIMESLRGISYVPSQKEVIKVVAKRVAKRLQEAKIAQRRLNKALGKK